MITFACPHCGFLIKVDARLVGKKGKCAHCAKPLTVPSLEAIAERALAPAATRGSTTDTVAMTAGAAQPAAETVRAATLHAQTGETLHGKTLHGETLHCETLHANGKANGNGHHAGASPATANADGAIRNADDEGGAKRFAAAVIPAVADADVDKLLVGVAADSQAAAESAAKAAANAPKMFTANTWPWQSAILERSTAARITSFLGCFGVLFFALLFDTAADASLGRANNLADVKLMGFIVSIGLILLGRFPNRIRFEKKI
jgi:hypothetical protein